MRNLKRALSLTLASIMLLGMMVVGSGAASYQDVTDDHNVEAIEVLQAVGIMVGDDGNFNPDKNVTRNEMAVIMSNLMDYRVASYSGTSPFTDVPSWAEPYVAACYTNGITSGTSATTYNGSGNVTTAQAALMIMKALGYFQYSADFGDDWQLAATRQANSIDLLLDVKSGVREAMTRNDVAQLVLNGLETGMVEADDSSKVEVSAGDMQVSVGGTKYVYVTSREKYAVAIKDRETLSYGATGTNQLSAPIVELGEKLYQGDLIKKAWEAGNTDDFGRPANTWTYQAKDIGSYAEDVETGRSFTAKVTPKKLYNAVGKTAAEKYDWTIYENGVAIYTEKDGYSALVKNQTNDSADFYRGTVGGDRNRTGNGVLTEVYVDGTREEVTVALTYYYPAEIYRVNSSDGRIILNSLESGIWGPASTSEEFEATGFEEDEIVYYTYAQNKIQSVAKAERIEGDVTKVVANTADDDGDNFNLGEDNYKYNMTMKSNKLITENVDNNMAGYIDANGYVVYIDKAAVTYDYAYVLSIGTDGDKADSSNINSTVYARLLLTDGSVVTVETDAKAKDVEDRKFLNHIVSYSKNSAGVYTMALKDNASASTSGTNGITNKLGTENAGKDIFENGKSPVSTIVAGGYIANSNTVFLTVDTNNSEYFSDWSFSTYTGIKNIPDIKSTKDTQICVAATDKSVAKVVYVQNADVSGSGDAIFVVANGGNDLTLSSGSTKYYELNAYVNGEKTTIKVKKDSNADTTLVQNAVANFNPTDGTYKDIAVNTSGAKYVVPVRTMSVDNDGLVTSVRLHDQYGGSAGTSGAKALSGTQTGRDRTTGNEVIYLGAGWARSWADGAKMVQYSVKNDAWTENIRISNTSVKDDTNDQWVAIFDDGEVIGLFIKDVENGETVSGSGATGNVTMGDNTATMDTDTKSSIGVDRLGNVGLTVAFKAPDWAKGVNEDTNVTAFTVTISDNEGEIVTLNKIVGGGDFGAVSLTGEIYSATALATSLSGLKTAIEDGKIDADQLTAKVTGVTWKYAAVQYRYEGGETVESTAITGANKMGIGDGNKANFSFTYTVPANKTGTNMKAAYANMTSTTASGAAVTGGSPVTFNAAYAGNAKVIITISGVTTTTPAEKHTVQAVGAAAGKVKFAVVDAPAPANAAAVEAIDASEWLDSVPAAEDQIVLIKSVKPGIKLTAVTAIEPEGGSVSTDDVATSTGYFKFVMGDKAVNVTAVTTDEVTVEKGFAKSDGSAINLKVGSTPLGTDAEKLQLAYDWLTANKADWGVKAIRDPSGAISYLETKDGFKIEKTAITVGDDLKVVTIDEDEVVGATDDAAPDALLALAGKPSGDANHYIKVTDGGSDGAVASNSTTETDTPDGCVIDTNEGKYYAKLVAFTVEANNAIDDTANSKTATAVVKNTTENAFQDANWYAAIGKGFTVTVTSGRTIAAGGSGYDFVIKGAVTNGAATVTGEITADGIAEGGAVDVTVTVTSVSGGALGAINLDVEAKS